MKKKPSVRKPTWIPTKPGERADEYIEIDPANEISEDDFVLGAMWAGYGDDVEKFREDCGGDPHWNPYDEDDAETLFSYGEHCREGKGVAQDYAQAAVWYRKAAKQNHSVAQSNLGVLYERGLGVKKDYSRAATWYRKSAEQGEPTAQCNLGKAYEYGRGVPQDYKQAAGWYRKAAEQGYAEAQLNLGYRCYRGLGVRKSYADAYFWMSIAAPEMKRKVRRKAEKELELITARLKPEQLSRAKSRVKQHLDHSVTGTEMKRDKSGGAKAKRETLKKSIREAKLAMKEAAQYVAALNKEHVKAQRSLEKAERNLARLKAKLDAAKSE
jgi:hypothetical protein